jgi:hypothetical protein
MKLKKVDETTYQVWDQDEINLLFTGDMKACDDFMHEEIKKRIEADPEWFLNQMKSFAEQLKVWKGMIDNISNQIDNISNQQNNNNDHKNDTTGENPIS